MKARPSGKPLGGSIEGTPPAAERELDLPSKSGATSLNSGTNSTNGTSEADGSYGAAAADHTPAAASVQVVTALPIRPTADRAAFPHVGEIWFQLSSSTGSPAPVVTEMPVAPPRAAGEAAPSVVKRAAQQPPVAWPRATTARRSSRAAKPAAEAGRKVPVYVVKRHSARLVEAAADPTCAEEHRDATPGSRTSEANARLRESQAREADNVPTLPTRPSRRQSS